MDIILTIPDNKKAIILDAYAGLYNYQTDIQVLDPSTSLPMFDPSTGEPITTSNPESLGAFGKRMVIQGIKDTVHDWNVQERARIYELGLLVDSSILSGIDIT